MGLKINYEDGQTPLDEDEKEGKKFGREVFTWGAHNLVHGGEFRALYLNALRAADRGNYELLIQFARS